LGFVVIAVHEAGHLVAGWAVGFRFHSVRVRCFHLERDGRCLRLRWIWMPDAPRRIGGFAQMSPRGEGGLRPRLAVFCAGGPVASLLFALALLVPACQLAGLDASPGSSASHAGLIFWLSLIGSLSLLGFLLSLAPRIHEGWQTDGAALLALLGGGPQADLFCLTYEIAGVTEGAVPVRHWPEELLTRLIHLHRWDRQLLIRTWDSLIQCGRTEESPWLLVRLLHRRPDLTRELYADICDAAAILLAHCGEHTAARAFLEQAAATATADPPVHQEAERTVVEAEHANTEAVARATGEPQAAGRSESKERDPKPEPWLAELVALSGANLARLWPTATEDIRDVETR
jgi:hypothetical protein